MGLFGSLSDLNALKEGLGKRLEEATIAVTRLEAALARHDATIDRNTTATNALRDAIETAAQRDTATHGRT